MAEKKPTTRKKRTVKSEAKSKPVERKKAEPPKSAVEKKYSKKTHENIQIPNGGTVTLFAGQEIKDLYLRYLLESTGIELTGSIEECDI